LRALDANQTGGKQTSLDCIKDWVPEPEKNMFKHILLPTDGSALSERTAQQAIKVAKALGAKITVVHVIGGYDITLASDYLGTPDIPDVRQRFAQEMAVHAKEILSPIKGAARKAGVECDSVVATGDSPYETILKQAAQSGCDLIMMASHGKKGYDGVLLGSETQKVLTHGKIPVLVCK
jgi:nucleotide-binding universal stress UspA family protein